MEVESYGLKFINKIFFTSIDGVKYRLFGSIYNGPHLNHSIVGLNVDAFRSWDFEQIVGNTSWY